MSQEKVDQYKEKKVHRKEIFEKEKRKEKRDKMLFMGGICILLAIFVGGIGVSTYNTSKAKAEAKPNYEREALVISDLNSVLEN